MFYDSAEIDENLRCSFCKQQLTGVVKLVPDCGESICGKCDEELKSQTGDSGDFECRACDQVHSMPKSGLQDNKCLSRLLAGRTKLDRTLSDCEKTLKASIESARNKLSFLESFDGRDFINHHCDQLELDVREAVESAVKNFNALEGDLLKEIGEYRQQRLETYSAVLLEATEDRDDKLGRELGSLVKEVNELSSKWNECFGRRAGPETDTEIEAVLGEVQRYKSRMQLLESKLKSSAVNGRAMAIKIKQSFFQDRAALTDFIRLSINDEAPSENSVQPTPKHVLAGHLELVNRAVFLANNRIASCSQDRTIKIWDTENGTMLFELRGHQNSINALVLLSNGSLASGSCDRTIRIWDLLERKQLKTLYGHMGAVVALQVLKNGRLASASTDNTVRIWDPTLNDNNNLVLVMKGHGNTSWVIPIGLLSNDNVVTCSLDKPKLEECILRVWSPSEGRRVKSVPTGKKGIVSLLVLSNDQVALSCERGSLMIVDLMDEALSRTKYKAHEHWISTVAQLSNANLVTVGKDNCVLTMKIWNLSELRLLQTVPTGHADSVYSITFSPNGELCASASRDKTLRLWNLVIS